MTDEDKTTPDFTDDRVKHLGMIQDVVERMANSSAWMKRMALVVVGAAAALAVRGNGQTGNLPLLAISLAVIFWGMDARYHQQERWFRRMYDTVRKEPHNQRPDFRISPDAEIRRAHGLCESAVSWSTFPYYLAMAGFLVLVQLVKP